MADSMQKAHVKHTERLVLRAVLVTLIPLVAVVLVSLAQVNTAAAQTVVREEFEDAANSWQVLTADAAYRLVSHQRVRDEKHSGEGSEQIRLLGNNGSYVYIGHAIGQARIIPELAPSLWLKADRPGLQFYVRAVLPRTEDPRTGGPVTTLLPGARYTQPGTWQQLRIDDIPQQLARHVRVLRSQIGSHVDPREAYIDQIVLNIYGGPGVTTVWIDQLEVAGVVDARGPGAEHRAQAYAPASVATPVAFDAPAQQIELQGTLLVAGGRTVLPRIIQHRGEPLSALQQLGFNTVQLSTPASESLLAEARRLGLWLIAPPPTPAELEGPGITAAYDPVIAWSLGTHLSTQDLERVRALAAQLRRRDPRAGRPLIADCQSDLRSFSRIADILVIGHSPLGTSLELSDYARWIAERPQFARPGTPIWSRIQTDFDLHVQNQWRALFPTAVASAAIDPEQLRFLVHASLAAGARGLVFDSHTPLTSSDAAGQQRRLTLELMNLELRMIEPWATGGGTRSSAHSSDTSVTGAMLQTERSRLLLPLAAARHDQFVPHRPPTGPIAFVVPGVPESNNAYELTGASLPPLRHQRVTGGIRVTQERSDSCAMVLMTGDPRVISSLSREVQQHRRRTAELKREQAIREFAQVEFVHRRLPQQSPVAAQCDAWLEQARGSLAQCQTLWGASDFPGAYREARRTLGTLGRIERARWREAVDGWPSLMTSPFAVTFGTLPQHAEFAELLKQSQRHRSQLPAGDMESLEAMMQAGWTHVKHPLPGVSSSVELSLLEPRSGRFSLRLKVWADEQPNPVTAVETAPLWVTTPPVSVPPGQLVCISGWVRVPEPITGSFDGLLIVDSLGGPALAERVKETMNWQEFTLYRVAPESGQLSVTFALTGFGEAWLDEIRIEPVQRAMQAPAPQARQLPAGFPPGAAAR